jgi:autotransporter-associated beta strand protein
LTFGGIITGSSANLTKTGTGTLSLTAANTYTGTTTVSQGVIKISNNLGLGDNGTTRSSTTVADGAAVWTSGSLTGVTEPITISGTGIG